MGQRIDDCLIPPLGITVKRKAKRRSVKLLLSLNKKREIKNWKLSDLAFTPRRFQDSIWRMLWIFPHFIYYERRKSTSTG